MLFLAVIICDERAVFVEVLGDGLVFFVDEFVVFLDRILLLQLALPLLIPTRTLLLNFSLIRYLFILNLFFIREIFRVFFGKSFAIALDEGFYLGQVVADVDSLPLIQLRSFQNPQIMTTVMTEWH